MKIKSQTSVISTNLEYEMQVYLMQIELLDLGQFVSDTIKFSEGYLLEADNVLMNQKSDGPKI